MILTQIKSRDLDQSRTKGTQLMQTLCSHCAYLQNVDLAEQGRETICPKCKQTFVTRKLSPDQINYEFGDHDLHKKFGWGALGCGLLIGILPKSPFFLSIFIGGGFAMLFFAISKIMQTQKAIISQLNDQLDLRIAAMATEQSPSTPSAYKISKQAELMDAAHAEFDEDDKEQPEEEAPSIPLA